MKKISTIFAALSLLAASSCTAWMDLTPTTSLSDKSVWMETRATDMYINNFYQYLDVYGSFGTGQFNGNLTEGLTDVLKYGSYVIGSRSGDCNFYVFTPETISAAGCIMSTWAPAYERIRRVNEFLRSMEKYSTYSEEVNTRYRAQAYFFRAFLNFQLAKRHGGNIILYRSVDEITKDRGLDKPEEVWQVIYDDLTYAAEHLPEAWDSANSGRVTSYAAYAMLSRAMLYAERWEDARKAAEKVIGSGRYDLMDSFSDGLKGTNAESILEFRYDVTAPCHYWDRYMAMFHEYTTGGSSTPTQEFVEEFEDRSGNRVDWSAWHTAEGTSQRPPYESLEPRFAASVIYPGCTWKGETIQCCVNGTRGRYIDYNTESYPYGLTTTGYYVRKFRQEDNDDLVNVPSTATWIEIRYSEVLLNHAEACLRTNMPDEGRASLAKVRERVGLPTAESLAGDELFAAIRHERKVELFLEGHLWWDMRRWRLAEEEYTGYSVHGMKLTPSGDGYRYELVDCDGGKTRKFLSRMYTLPIPVGELQSNGKIEQLPEWNF